MKCCFRNSTLATGPNGVEAHLCLEMQMQCGEALFDLFPEVMSFGKCAASGCTLLDSPHLLKHEKKKMCAWVSTAVSRFDLLVMHEFVYVFVFVSKRVETAYAIRLISPKVIWFYRKKRGFKHFWECPKILRLLSRFFLWTVILCFGVVSPHLCNARAWTNFVSRLFVCLLLFGLLFLVWVVSQFQTGQTNKTWNTFSRFLVNSFEFYVPRSPQTRRVGGGFNCFPRCYSRPAQKSHPASKGGRQLPRPVAFQILFLLEWNVVSEILLWPQGPTVWKHTFVWKCKCNAAKLYLTFFPKWCLLGNALRVDAHLLK